MIDEFWVATAVLVGASTPLFGAYWKLSNWSRSVQQRYASDISTIEARIRSSRLVPQIMALFDELLAEQRSHPDKTPAEILSDSAYADRISAIAEVDNEIGDVKNTYRDLRNSSYSLGRALLYIGIVLLLSVPLMYLYGLQSVPENIINLLFAGLAYTAIVICVAGVLPSLSKREKAQHAFSDKYDEIVVVG
jgi:hypothetical protein